MIRNGLIHYRSFLISSDDDISLMFDCHTLFPDIRIVELFIVLEESHFSSGGSAPDPVHIGMLLLERSLTFVVASLVQNENI